MTLTLDLELEKAIEKINELGEPKVLIQLPDGLKNKADSIQQELKQKTKGEFTFWLGSGYGACDLPTVEGFDLLITFGHSEWKF